MKTETPQSISKILKSGEECRLITDSIQSIDTVKNEYGDSIVVHFNAKLPALRQNREDFQYDRIYCPVWFHSKITDAIEAEVDLVVKKTGRGVDTRYTLSQASRL